jgi:hypothetical protein
MSRNAVRRLGAAFAAVSALVEVGPRPALAQGTTATDTSKVPIAGSFTLGGTAAPFQGLFTIERFAQQNGKLVAVGTLSDPASPGGSALALTLPVAADPKPGACHVLDLALGPLHLDLLGLVVDTNDVKLTLAAQPGQGALLGNLVCAVTNLLGGGGTTLTPVVSLLNDVLGVLNGV